ncbi:MAG: hypothetical protein MK189_02970, partial [Acidimicrobiales bacterium]|nr:hypothetical protein [Acidimicrobiales bacterium]
MRLRGRRRRRRESRRFTYSLWYGTQSVPDLDADALLQAMGDELIEHGDPNAALRRILHDGLEVDGELLQGLREMLERLRHQRQEMLEQHDLGGVYDEIRDALGEVMETERGSLDGLEEVGDDVVAESTRRRREQLDLIGHENLAGQVRGLTDHDFTSTEAAERFEELLEELRRQLMQQAVDQMAGAMQDLSPEDLARMKDMLAELNQMLEQRRAGEVPDFDGFME